MWNFCGFGLKRWHLIFADFIFCVLKISAPKFFFCTTRSNNWSDQCCDKQLMHITVILRSKHIFSSLESFQTLQLLNTHLVNFKFVLRNYFFSFAIYFVDSGSISVYNLIYFGYIFLMSYSHTLSYNNFLKRIMIRSNCIQFF